MESVKHTLSSIVDIISGGTPSTANPDYWNGDIGWLSVADFNNDQRFVYYSDKTITRNGLNNSSTKLLSIGDTIISARGTVGALAQIGNEMAFNQSCFGLRAKQEFLNEDFLYYSLRNYVKNLKAKSQGSVFDTINLSTFDMIELEIPSLPHQQKIASVLSTLDEKIALNNQINATLEQMAKTLYDYWFVQFDFPDENGKPYKSSGGEMVYNETLKRDIPKGWEVKKLSEIAKTGSGGTPKSTVKEYYQDGTIPWINSGEVNNSIIVQTSNFITGLGLKESSAKLFPKNTILLAMYGATAGKASLLTFEATTNQAICAIMPNDEKYLIFLKTKLEQMYNYLVNLSSGSARDNLSQDKIKELQISIPTDELLEKFHLATRTMYEKIIVNSKENSELIKLRDWLLPMLMNGQVTVQ